MFKLVSVVVIVMAVFGTPVKTGVPPAGKCKDITPVPVEFNTVKIKYTFWQLAYVPDDEAFADMDSEAREMFSSSPNTVTAFNRRKSKNNTETRYSFKLIYGNDLQLYEDATDEKDNVRQFKWIPIAVVNKLNFLYYRCSDDGSLSIDTRFILIPKGQKLSLVDEQLLLAEDKKRNFVGGLRKLENKYA